MKSRYALLDRMTDHILNRAPALYLEPNRNEELSGDQRESAAFEANKNTATLSHTMKEIITDLKAITGQDENMTTAKRGIRKLFYEALADKREFNFGELSKNNTKLSYSKFKEQYSLDTPDKYINLSDEQWQKVMDTPFENLEKEDPDLYDHIVESFSRVRGDIYFNNLNRRSAEEIEKREGEREKEKERNISKNGPDPDNYLPKNWKEDPKIDSALQTLGIQKQDRRAMSLLVTNYMIAEKKAKIGKFHIMSYHEEDAVAKELGAILSEKNEEELKEWYSRTESNAMNVLTNDRDIGIAFLGKDIYSGQNAKRMQDEVIGQACRYADQIVRDMEKRQKDQKEKALAERANNQTDQKTIDTTYMLASLGRHFYETNHQNGPAQGHKKYYKTELIRRHAAPLLKGSTIKEIKQNLPLGSGKVVYRMMNHELSKEFTSKNVNYEKLMDGPLYKKTIAKKEDSI